jgi:hypothetical protein
MGIWGEARKAEGLIGNRYESKRWERLKKSKDEMSSVENQVTWR